MKMKICIFLTICYMIAGLCQCQADSWKCEFKKDTFNYLNASKKINISGYACVLSSNNGSAADVNKIHGQHERGKTDDDVEFLRIHSKLKSFTSIFCQKFKNLKAILSSAVEIEKIEGNAMDNCENLEVLRLGFNNLEEIPRKLLPQNLKVTRVEIYYNKLSSLSEKLFENQFQLEELHLYGNKIYFIPTNTFHPLINLRTLNLRKNKLQVLNPEWFVSLKNLKELNLEENQISELPRGIFKPLGNLEALLLNRNKLNVLSPSSFEGLQNLSTLSLWRNEIVELPSGLFVPLTNLKLLDLGFNHLTEIHSDSFGNHKYLTKILFDGNQIAALDERIFNKVSAESLGMWNNSCVNGSKYITKNEVKEKLRKCFESYQPRSSVSNVCGSLKDGNTKVTSGDQITRGSFPWIAVLEKTNGEFCCGTLVTSRKVVTAAHCVYMDNDTESLPASDITVLLGAHNLSDPNEDGRTSLGVLSIHIHPDWNVSTGNYDADIAVLILDQDVLFTQYIEPACLISRHVSNSKIDRGVVVGFKKSEDENYENIATVVVTSIYRNRNCYQKNHDLQKVSSKRTFCGERSSGTCTMESGNGLYAYHDGGYFLHGITLATYGSRTNQCDINSYAIYTNMMAFSEWVNGISFKADEIRASEYNGNPKVDFSILIYFMSIVLVWFY